MKNGFVRRRGQASNPCLAEVLERRQLLAADLTVTPSASTSALVKALLSGNTGISVTSAHLGFQRHGAAISIGTYVNPGAVFGIGNGIIMSSGNVTQYNSPKPVGANTNTQFNVKATAAQESLLDVLSNNQSTHFDVTELDLTFNMPATLGSVFFNVVFGSAEYPQFVGSRFVDAFGLYLNGQNIANVQGQPVNIDHPAFAPSTVTALPGVLSPGGNPLLQFSAFVGAGTRNNHLTFIIGDTSDAVLDTTAYISALGAQPANTNIPTATLAATGITTTQPTQTFAVTYTGKNLIDVTSIDSNDILVTGPNGYSQVATLVSTNPSINSGSIVATYSITATGGGPFTVADDGTYTASMQFDQVKDTLGNFVTEGSLGTFKIGVSGAASSPSATYLAGTPTYFFQVDYIDPARVKTTSIDNNDILVTGGPGNISMLAKRVNVTTTGDGTGYMVSAIYSLAAPGGANWLLTDAGNYTFTLQAGQVMDLKGGAIPAGVLATVSLSAFGGLSAPPAGEVANASTAAMAFDSTGREWIAYFDSIHQDLRYQVRAKNGHFSGIHMIDKTPGSGQSLSIAVEKGVPSVAYYNSVSKTLKYARFNGSTWTISNVDATPDVGTNPSLAFDASGLPAISYYDTTNQHLKLARLSGKTFVVQTLDSTGNDGLHSSIALDPATSKLAIAYNDATAGNLKLATEGATAFTPAVIPGTVDSGQNISLAFNSTGAPTVGFFNSGTGQAQVVQESAGVWTSVEHYALSSGAAAATGIQLLYPTGASLPQVLYVDSASLALVLGAADGTTATLFNSASLIAGATLLPGNDLFVLTQPVGAGDLILLHRQVV